MGEMVHFDMDVPEALPAARAHAVSTAEWGHEELCVSTRLLKVRIDVS